MCAERAHARGAVPVGSGGDRPSQQLALHCEGCWREDPGGRGLRRRGRGNSATCRARAALRAREGARACAVGGGGTWGQPRAVEDAALWPGLGIRPDYKGIKSQSKT